MLLKALWLTCRSGILLLLAFLSLKSKKGRRRLTGLIISTSSDVSRKSINAIENGIYVPSTVLALKIAKTLNCKIEDIFELPKN